MAVFQFICCAILMILGLVIMLGAAIGNLRFRSPLPRMHSIAMGDSVGNLCLSLGLLLCDWDGLAKMKLLLILLFFWLSGPVCSHLLCKYQVEEEEAGRELAIPEDRKKAAGKKKLLQKEERGEM